MAVDAKFLRIYGTMVGDDFYQLQGGPRIPDPLAKVSSFKGITVDSPLGRRLRVCFSEHFRNIPDHLLRFNASLPPAPAPWTPAVGDKVRLRDPRPSGVWTGGEVDHVLPEYILVRCGDGIRSAEDLSALEPVPVDEFAIQEGESAPEEELDAEGFIIPKTDNSTTFERPVRSRNIYRTAEPEPHFKVGDWARMTYRIDGSPDSRWGVVEGVVGSTVFLRTWWPALNTFTTFVADERNLFLLHRGSGR